MQFLQRGNLPPTFAALCIARGCSRLLLLLCTVLQHGQFLRGHNGPRGNWTCLCIESRSHYFTLLHPTTRYFTVTSLLLHCYFTATSLLLYARLQCSRVLPRVLPPTFTAICSAPACSRSLLLLFAVLPRASAYFFCCYLQCSRMLSLTFAANCNAHFCCYLQCSRKLPLTFAAAWDPTEVIGFQGSSTICEIVQFLQRGNN